MLTFEPLTGMNWDSFVDLFGERGACGGCWCTYWKMSPKLYQISRGAMAYQFQKQVVESGNVPGILGFEDGLAVGWIAFEPRTNYPRMEKARSMRSPDEKLVWSISCFFTRKSHRHRGITVGLLHSAIEHARENGAKILEGYPTDAKMKRMPDPFVYTGLSKSFELAGFTEVARNTPSRPVYRLTL